MSDESLLPQVSRRGFLRTGLFGSVAGGLGVFGVASLAMLYPSAAGGFGSVLTLPRKAADLLDEILDTRSPFEYQAGRMFVVAWDPSVDGALAKYGDNHVSDVDGSGMGLMALHQKCVHLGCRVPWCQSSQWYECPCHGSRYNKWGEYTGGPASRGLDRFPSELDGEGNMLVDTGTLLEGTARTANILQQEREGPSCA